MNKKEILENVKYDENGLVVCIIQDYHSKHIRMVAYMNEEALIKTLESGQMTYYSRSRKSLWVKGETSGYFQYMKGLSIDCDGDALLFQIEQKGGISCHTGNVSCFYRDLDEDVEFTLNRGKIINSDNELNNLEATIIDRIKNPKEGSYTNYLITNGENKILKKVGEEATETILACKDNKKEDIIFEIADLMYHLTVEMALKGVSWHDIEEELKKR
ncbi:MAG: bifunctional phosphoribosyl-AMP cyclohydrolase/phosphoribosyl-ATP diphosphatase HisIE [Anaeroplasma sp.]